MRIAFDMLIVEREQSEDFANIYALIENLAIIGSTHEYIIISGHKHRWAQLQQANIQLYIVNIDTHEGILLQHQLLLPDILQRLQPDLIHIPHYTAPIGWPGPIILSLYHVPFFDETDPLCQHSIYRYQHSLLRESIKQAQHIITTSGKIYTQLLTHWAARPEQVHIITRQLQAHLTLRLYQDVLPITTQTNQAGLQHTEQKTPLKVSVIIPASRPAKAAQALQTLQQQIITPNCEMEIIVVGPPAHELARQYPVVAINPGPLYEPGKVRNIGVRHATGSILLFLDDDMLVGPHWVEQNIAAIQETQVGIVGARIPGKQTGFFARCVDFTNYGHYQHRTSLEIPVGSGSMAIWRTIFESVGGFEENFRSGEDIDLCYRVQKHGYRSVYRPEIVAIHDHRNTSWQQLLCYNYRHGRLGGLITKVRHYECGLPNRLLFFIRHPLAFLLLCPLIALVATLRIVLLNVRDHKRVMLYMPFIFLGKLAYEFGILVHLIQEKIHHEHLSKTTGKAEMAQP